MAYCTVTETSILAPLPDPTEPQPLEPFEAVIARVLDVAREHPDDPAVVLGGTVWPYRQLCDAALALAGELAGLGVGPGQAVGVTGTKSPGLVTVILAVLARNAILVPLDPALPELRRREMLERADAALLIEAGEPAGIAPIDLSGTNIRRYSIPVVPAVTDEIRAQAGGYQLPEIDGDDPMYLLFTSGTTGEPKGIVGRQRGLAHFLAWERRATGVGPGDRVAQLTGLSFDVVLRDLFLPLTSGAALHMPPFAPGATAPEEVLAFLARDRVTIIHAVPTIAAFWLSYVPEGIDLSALRWVLFAGEPLPGALVRRWREAFGTRQVGNLYGPTETTLAKCFAEVGAAPEDGIQPVGRAIPGAQALVLDGDRLCGPGELGEIVIRTPYRSLGYLGASGDPRPPFIRNPFTDDPADLVYRTGDRGRYRADGVLEIHGRLDDQIKILGVRIEPSEVTAALLEHPGVRSAAVVAHDDPRGEKALVAYLVPQNGHLDERDVRSHLAGRLLPAKVPRLFVTMRELPRTPNGKIDRRALPQPSWNGDAHGAGAMDPAATASAAGPGGAAPGAAIGSDAATDAVTAIFRELLGSSSIGPDDDFFQFGGHSLLAARLIQRIESRLGVRVQVRSLFIHPTARGLAGLVVGGGEGSRPASASAGGTTFAAGAAAPTSAAGAAPPPRPAAASTASSTASGPAAGATAASGAAADALVPIHPAGTLAPLFAVPGVGSRILFLRRLARHLGDDQPLYGLHTRFLDDGSVYEHIEDLAAVYVRAIRAVQPEGPYQLVGFSYGGLVAFEVARQLAAAGLGVGFLGVVDSRLPGLQMHGRWSVPRSVPRRVLNLAALLQPLSVPARRSYLRMRLAMAWHNGEAHLVRTFHERFPNGLFGWAPAHPYGPDELEWVAADRAASRRYTPQPFPGRIDYFWAAHTQHPASVYDHREGWAELARGGMDVHPVPGNHLTVMAEPLIASTAAAIRHALADTRASR